MYALHLFTMQHLYFSQGNVYFAFYQDIVWFMLFPRQRILMVSTTTTLYLHCSVHFNIPALNVLCILGLGLHLRSSFLYPSARWRASNRINGILFISSQYATSDMPPLQMAVARQCKIVANHLIGFAKYNGEETKTGVFASCWPGATPPFQHTKLLPWDEMSE